MKMSQKPHGLEIITGYQIFNPDGTLVHNIQKTSELQGFIEIENLKNGKKSVLPMRSFVNNFINTLHGILTGDGGTDTYKTSVSFGASLSASVVDRAGILIGQDVSQPDLGDTDLVMQLTHASLAYKQTTFVDPNVGSGGILNFEVRRIFTNSKATAIQIEELGVMAQRVNASAASNAGLKLLSRDAFSTYGADVPTSPVTFPADSDIRFTFKFKVSQDAGGNGGAVLNLLRMIYNLMFVGNQNYPGSYLRGRNNTTVTNIAYATGATAASTNPFVVDGSGSEPYIGLVVGYYDQEYSDLNPIISGDDYIMQINHNNLTVGANTVSAVSNPSSGVAQFTISRDFTNSSTTQKKYIDRIGLLTKGTADGATLGTNQCYLMMMRPTTNDSSPLPNSIELQPSQILRPTCTFKIRV